MIAVSFALAIAFLIAALLHIRRANPALMFATSGATFLAIAGILFALSRFAPHYLISTSFSQPGADSVYHDTYYVVARFHYVALMAVGPLIATALVGLQHLIGALYWPRLTRWLFWPFMFFYFTAPLISAARQYQMPRRYLDYPEAFNFTVRLESYAAFISFIAAALLLTLFIGSLIKRALRARQA